MEMIVCVDLNWGIGSENNLLFRLKTDMEFFKNVTRRKTLLMGRKTYESLSVKPLPNRRNVVLTSTQKYTSIRNLEYITSIENAIEKYDDIVCIGGSSVYEQCLNYCDIIYVTKVFHCGSNVDSYFPNIDEMKEWENIAESEILAEVDSDGKERYFQFMQYRRKK